MLAQQEALPLVPYLLIGSALQLQWFPSRQGAPKAGAALSYPASPCSLYRDGPGPEGPVEDQLTKKSDLLQGRNGKRDLRRPQRPLVESLKRQGAA